MNNEYEAKPAELDEKQKQEFIDSTMNYFYENLKNVEAEFGLSRSEIASVCNVNKSTVTQWFNKTNVPPMSSVYFIAKRIHRDPADFFKEDGIHPTGQNKFDTETSDELKKNFMENLKKIQTEFGFSKAQIANFCHVSRPTIGQWFSGASWPKLRDFFYLAAELNLTVGSFLKKDGVKLVPERFYKGPQAPFMTTGQKTAESSPAYDILSSTETEKDKPLSASDLTPQERAIIASFRSLSEEGKNFILHALSLEVMHAKMKFTHGLPFKKQ